MLTNKDIELIRSTREDVRGNRTIPIILYSEIENGKHPISGEPIIDSREDSVDAIVSEVSVRTSLDRRMENGIEIFTGDILIDVSLEDMPEGVTGDDVVKVKYVEKDYTVLAADYIGLGGFNRVEFIGRLTK